MQAFTGLDGGRRIASFGCYMKSTWEEGVWMIEEREEGKHQLGQNFIMEEEKILVQGEFGEIYGCESCDEAFK